MNFTYFSFLQREHDPFLLDNIYCIVSLKSNLEKMNACRLLRVQMVTV